MNVNDLAMMHVVLIYPSARDIQRRDDRRMQGTSIFAYFSCCLAQGHFLLAGKQYTIKVLLPCLCHYYLLMRLISLIFVQLRIQLIDHVKI